MVHAFKFAYHDKAYHFVWDNESGSLHNVDYVAFLYAKKRYGQALDEKESKDFFAINQADLQELEKEFDELETMGILNTPCTSFAKKKRIGEIKALCLHICNDCNLRCKYCFADEGTYHTQERAYMSEEVGKKAIDFLIAHSGKRNNLEVDFFGGEPLMNLDVVKAIVEYARSREKESGKSFNFTMTTNCVLLNDKNIEWLNKEMYNVVLSIDGRHDVHRAVRKAVNGKDCYDLIANNAIKFAKARGDKSYYVRGTFTPRTWILPTTYLRSTIWDLIKYLSNQLSRILKTLRLQRNICLPYSKSMRDLPKIILTEERRTSGLISSTL